MSAPHLLEAVKAAHDAGVCIIPASTNGQKRPWPDGGAWEHWQQERPTYHQLQRWFGPAGAYSGIGAVCGEVSGNLEMLEFEGRAVNEGLLEAFDNAATEAGIWDLVKRLVDGYCEQTPSGGIHLLYRCATIEGNLKLARRPATEDELAEKPDDKIKVLIETRGKGGFVILAPSNGTTHPTGGAWELVSGGFDTIPTITEDERAQIFALARTFDQIPAVELYQPKPRTPRSDDDELRPGDDYTARTTWDQVLGDEGWVHAFDHGTISYWRRPGASTHGTDATTNSLGTDRLKVFSTSTEFDTDTTYSRFGVYALLKHAGDFEAAASALRAQGYGAPTKTKTKTGKGKDGGSGSGGTTQGNGGGDEAAAPDGYRLTDAGNAERLIMLSAGQLRYIHAWGRWVVYNGGRWVIDSGDALVTELSKTVAKSLLALAVTLNGDQRDRVFKWGIRSESSGTINAMVRLARGDRRVITRHEDLDKNPYLLNVTNGTVDLRTGELLPHNPDDLITLQAPVEYDPDACAPLWERCLARWQPDRAHLEYIQREVGAGATGIPTESISVHYGGGGNGKSKFICAVQYVLGEYAVVPHKSLLVTQRHEQHETVKADLFRKRLAVATETRSVDVLDEEQVKNLTGGDPIRARRMREDSWEFDPTHTLIITTNYKPVIHGNDEAIWRRVRLVPWDVTIPAEERDVALSEKLRDEAGGILAWVVAGAQRFLENGLEPPDTIRAVTASYRLEEDIVGRFIAEVLQIGPGRWATAADIKTELDNWCHDQGFRVPRMNEIAAALEAKGCTSGRQTVAGRKSTIWTRVGIVAAPHIEPLTSEDA